MVILLTSLKSAKLKKSSKQPAQKHANNMYMCVQDANLILSPPKRLTKSIFFVFIRFPKESIKFS